MLGQIYAEDKERRLIVSRSVRQAEFEEKTRLNETAIRGKHDMEYAQYQTNTNVKFKTICIVMFLILAYWLFPRNTHEDSINYTGTRDAIFDFLLKLCLMGGLTTVAVAGNTPVAVPLRPRKKILPKKHSFFSAPNTLSTIDPQVKDDIGNTELLHFVAKQQSSGAAFKLLIEHGADLFRGDRKYNWTAFHWAAFKNNVTVLEYLWKNRPDEWNRMLNFKTGNGVFNGCETILHVAARGVAADALEYLIKKGADINSKDQNGYTPLHWAVEKRAGDCARILIREGADLNARDGDGSRNGKTPRDLLDLTRNEDRDFLNILDAAAREIRSQAAPRA